MRQSAAEFSTAIRELARFDRAPEVPDWFADPTVQRRMSELIARSSQDPSIKTAWEKPSP
jgi:hypothetical protein